MQVAMISKALVVGAYQKKCEELAKLPNIDLTVIVPPSWQEEVRLIKLEHAYTHGYKLVVNPILLNGNFHFHVYPGLGRVLSKLKPDIVHMDEEPYNLSTLQMQLAAQRAGARTLFFTWQNLYRRYPPPFRWIEQYIYRHAAYALAGNSEAVGILQRKGYRGPVAVIPQFGIDPTLFKPASEGRRDGSTFRIGYIGRLVEQKGVQQLMEAVLGLDGDWQLDFIGDGPLRAQLAERAEQAGVAARVCFAVVPSVEVPRRLQQFDVVVLPSLTRPNWKEQFGRTVMEAMACGVPVIVSDSGELANVAGDAGLTIPEGDVAALKAAIQRLRADPILRADLAARGRARALSHYTQAQIAEQTYSVYKEILGERSRE